MDWKNQRDPSAGSGPRAKASGFGDNLRILRQYVADESVDLIYLGPPFNSNATGAAVAPTFRSAYACVALTFRSASASVALTFRSASAELKLGATKSGEESAAQITAFGDTWHWGRESEAVYREIVERGPRQLADLVQALPSFLGGNDLMAARAVFRLCLRLAQGCVGAFFW